MIEGYLALERAYTQGRNAPGAPLLVSFDGRLQTMPDMEGPPREHLVVERFEATEPGRRCHPAEAPRATLTNTYWKLTEMAGSPVAMLPGQAREVRITLDEPGARVHGFSGCNRLQGQYASSGDRLAFSALGGTRMACPAPVMALEAAVLQALGRATGYRIDGEALSLLDGERVLARFAAVYLR
jgi:putative lipoprotein